MATRPARRAIAEAEQRSRWPVKGLVTKIYYPELLRALEGTLSRCSLSLAVVSTHFSFKEG
jgi:hypothetical protein